MEEIIIRYHGNLTTVFQRINARNPEILTEQYAIAYVTEEQLEQLRNMPEIEYIELPKTLLLEDARSLQASCAYTVQSAGNGELTGAGVLIAVLDSGIQYQNEYFKYEDGTSRIVNLWDQTENSGNPPEGFEIGSEYNREDLTDGNSPQTDPSGHGTAVAAIALETAPGSELIVVKLAVSPDYAFTKTTSVMRALKYVIEKARRMNQPVVVNLSLGTNSGSHSGDSLFETYIDEWARRWKNNIVIAAGNEGIAGRHAAGIMKNFEQKRIEFQVQGRQLSVSLQIWRSFLDPMEVGVLSPGGESTGIQPAGVGVYRREIQGNTVSIYYGEPNPYTMAVPILIDLSNSNGLSEGIWALQLESQNVTSGSYNIWISSDVEIRRNVYFLEPEEDVTITIPSVTERTIAVAAYDTATNAIADFSGRGYTRNATMIKPDLAAPGVRIGLPEETGIRQVFNGTSIAAPIAAGCCAIMMEWGIVKKNDPDMFGERLKAFLLKGADRRLRGRVFPDKDWGYGKLCLESALREAAVYRKENWMRKAEDCNGKAVDEDYLDIVYQSESVSEIAKIVPIIEEDCAVQLYEGHFLVYVGKQDLLSPETIYSELPIANIPVLYGLAVDTAAVDFIGSSQLAQSPAALTGSQVILGIIDTGIDYRHPAFADEYGNSKIFSIWDQTQSTGTPPEGFAYGSEYTRDQIEAALAASNPLDIVPEIDENGHGTYIAGVAAGYRNQEETFSGAAPGAELIVVKLKQAKNELKRFFRLRDSELAYSHTDILLATQYIVKEAERLDRPVVLLYALSTSFGPHDGSLGIERYLHRLAYYEGIGIFTAAGNEANKGHHAQGKFGGTMQREQQTVEWNVDAGEEGLCLMVWSRSPDTISIEVSTPTGFSTGLLPYIQDEVYRRKAPLDSSQITVSYKVNTEGNGDSCILIRLRNPTAGIWKMVLTGELIINGEYHIWMTLSNWTRAETRFLKPEPFYTVTMPATGDGSISIGGYDISGNSIYASSGRGPSRSQMLRPDLAAPATGIFGPQGSNSYQALSGTSAAAALAAGAGAQLMEWGIVRGNQLSMNTNQMRRILIRGAVRRPGIEYPNNEWGYGLLDIFQSVEYL